MRPRADRETVATAFKLQAGYSKFLGSALYAGLADRARADVEAEGPVWQLVRDFEGDPLTGFLPLRVFGAVHAEALSGDAPELARFYPTAGGRADPVAAWPHFRALVDGARERLRPRLERFPQTNEVRRTAGLLGGFLTVARQARLPIRLLELGCSAGLNLQWSRFRFELGCWSWGSPESPVRIQADWQGSPPDGAEVSVRVVERRGCDIAPRSIDDERAVRDLECFVWADQPERLVELRAAVGIARQDPPRIDRASAGDWLPEQLESLTDGVCTVVYHSSVWSYLSADEQTRVRDQIAAAGSCANADRPLAWLRAEDSPDRSRIELRLRSWPGGEEIRLGEGHAHGRRVIWSPGSAP